MPIFVHYGLLLSRKSKLNQIFVRISCQASQCLFKHTWSNLENQQEESFGLLESVLSSRITVLELSARGPQLYRLIYQRTIPVISKISSPVIPST
jgi:hypothetical protein